MTEQKYAVVVDDDNNLRSVASDILEMIGFSTKTAVNGLEGLVLIEGTRPHLIITDGDMPEMTGPQMIEKLREKGILTPVIFTSGNHEMIDDLRSKSYQNVEYLPKPYKVSELKAKINTFVL